MQAARRYYGAAREARHTGFRTCSGWVSERANDESWSRVIREAARIDQDFVRAYAVFALAAFSVASCGFRPSIGELSRAWRPHSLPFVGFSYPLTGDSLPTPAELRVARIVARALRCSAAHVCRSATASKPTAGTRHCIRAANRPEPGEPWKLVLPEVRLRTAPGPGTSTGEDARPPTRPAPSRPRLVQDA